MRLYDNHNHSQFSFDGRRASVETSAAAAKKLGLSGMCFTDHCDFFVPPMKADFEKLVPEVFDVSAQQAEIDRVSKDLLRSPNEYIFSDHENGPDGAEYISECETIPKEKLESDGFKIYKGIEIGLYGSCLAQNRGQLAAHEFDEVIASVHYIDDTDPFFGGYYVGKTWREAYGHYLETLFQEMVRLGDFDIMGHFDYVARYAPYSKTGILYRDFPDLFDAMLRYLAENGKALEINTKTYQTYSCRPFTLSPAGRPVPPPGSALAADSSASASSGSGPSSDSAVPADAVPTIERTIELDPDILRRFRELGGEMISLGSDSHDPSRPGTNFPFFVSLVRSCGFRHLVHFSARRPLFDAI